MRMTSKSTLTLLAVPLIGAAITGCGGSGGSSGEFPSGSITMIVPYSAGGPSDQTTRAIAPYFEEEFGVNVQVENVPGASGALGQQEMMQNPADGLTVQLIASTSMAVVPQAEDVGYTLDDVTPVGAVAEFPYLLASNASSNLDTEAFFEKAQDDKVRVGVPGAQSQGAIELQRLVEAHGLNITIVPFDGNADANTALLGNNIDAVFEVASDDVRGYIESGDFVPVALDSTGPVGYLDGVPTLEELGYEGINLGTSYYGLGVHADTDEKILDRYEEATEAALQDEEVRKRIGQEYVPQEYIGGEKLMNLYTEQSEAYAPFLG